LQSRQPSHTSGDVGTLRQDTAISNHAQPGQTTSIRSNVSSLTQDASMSHEGKSSAPERSAITTDSPVQTSATQLPLHRPVDTAMSSKVYSAEAVGSIGTYGSDIVTKPPTVGLKDQESTTNTSTDRMPPVFVD
ncbi:hypothetical protein KCU78_g3912, partial [Aureobasidium melanogenum]